MKRRHLMIGLICVIGITIIGICDTLNDGVAKREKEQEIRSERLERNQDRVQERLLRQQQKMYDDMKRRQTKP